MATEPSKRIELAILTALPGARVDLRPVADNGRVWGFVFSDRFDGLEHADRQRLVRDALRASLSREEQLQIGGMLTMTPEEASDD